MPDTYDDLPDWCRPGREVASIYRDHAVKVTIERMTATRVVLTNGKWFRRDSLAKSDRNGYGTTELVALTDRRYIDIAQRATISNLLFRLDDTRRKARALDAETVATLSRLTSDLGKALTARAVFLATG